MRVHLLLITILTTIVSTISAQDRVDIGVDYDMLFDNTEYSSAGYHSGTTFAGKLNLMSEIKWDRYNTLVVGAELINNFGEQTEGKLFAESTPIIYYQYEKQNVKLVAGMFPTSLMHIESYSPAFFSASELFYYNVGGVMAQYNGDDGESFAEFVCNWEGKYSEASREKFRILAAARRYYDNFYFGANFSMFHFAGQPAEPYKTVVDHNILNPRLGYRREGLVDFDIYAGALITAQRDRGYGDKMIFPTMGELGVKFDYKWFSLDSRLYVGDNLNPFYDGNITDDGIVVVYGDELYPNDCFFRSTNGYYNRSALAFQRSCFEDTVKIKAEIATHYDGAKLGSQYLLSVGVKLRKTVYDDKKCKK